jgi:tRNA nucleotidyltransferase (CCA-adding enzyme)
MEIYLVGGAVRDELLKLPVKDKDYVVVGATAEEMLKKKFKQVGKDFPVFLHPDTKEEYALARVERKIGLGYTGFSFDTSPKVTIEEDLLRRDLTINAIAKKVSDGEIVDPYHGREDIEKKILRHVSPAFAEDPVRILRVGRFAARFAALGFKVAPETTELMLSMVKAGEVNALVAERVWAELSRALQEKNPEKFFRVLKNCDALEILFPGINHRNIAALKTAATYFNDPESLFAVLCHGLTETQLDTMCQRYRIPASYRELAHMLIKLQPTYNRAFSLSAEELLLFLQSADAFRREERFKKLLSAMGIIGGTRALSMPFLAALKAAKVVDPQKHVATGAKGQEIAALIHQERLDSIKKILR